jgi:SM-20-related protein
VRADGGADGAAIADAIADDGYAVVPAFAAEDLVARLRDRARSRDEAGEFVAAGVGRDHARNAGVRGDRIRWIEAASADEAETDLIDALDAARRDVNRALTLGALDLELHYAIYPPGAGYARHRDRLRSGRDIPRGGVGCGDARVLSCVVYLNDGWRDDDGGALRLHLDHGVRDVMPTGGTLVAFLSDRLEHEVLPARRERMAVAGWFRQRA